MRITLGVTDNDWADYLRARPGITEANFWVPSAQRFTGRASLDEPFLFKTKTPRNQLVGGGFYAGYYEQRVSEAWAIFGEGNGVGSEAELERAIRTYRDRTGKEHHPDPTIGCVVVRNLFFAPEGEDLPQPPHWGRSIVQGKTLDPTDIDYEYVEHAFRSLQGGARLDLLWDRDLIDVDLDSERYGAPVLTRPRLGQGSFRLAVLDAYGNRCAVSGGRMAPTLEAAHIRPYARGGRHLVSNGLTLRSDLHALYDRGYLGVDADYRLRVSPRIQADFGNGVELYSREARGEVIRLPVSPEDRPDREALEWHMDEVFLSA
ncbi:MAG: HNH endonuclease [Nocardioidaceae bacterium]|nr:HNH endonuclease [Nocardioidaceae bacterium]MCL2613619.1 HNH endonuclease [Nocardioidaceae bacterium]